jgi:hypothetical protein
VKTVTAGATPNQTPAHPSPRLLDQERSRIRVLRHAIDTAQVYPDWIKRHIRYFDKRHPRNVSLVHVERF